MPEISSKTQDLESRDDRRDFLYRSTTFMVAVLSEGGYTDEFRSKLDKGTFQLLLNVSELLPDGWAIKAKKFNPPNMILRTELGVEVDQLVITLRPAQDSEFSYSKSDFINLKGENTRVRNMDTDVEFDFELYGGLRLSNEVGDVVQVFCKNEIIGENTMDGRNSGVIIIHEGKEPEFYPFQADMIEAPRVISPF